jgi:hypothetical protein
MDKMSLNVSISYVAQTIYLTFDLIFDLNSNIMYKCVAPARIK